jgi:8-oxo-dGTP diphosphatase
MQKITVCGLAYKIEEGVRKVFLARRAVTKKFLPGKLELVGGHVELEDKSLEEALKREVAEELGAEIAVEDLAGEFLYFNDTQNSQSIEVIYWIRFVDEAQVKLNPEDHSEFVWVTEEEMDKLIEDKNDLECIAIKKAFKGLKV